MIINTENNILAKMGGLIVFGRVTRFFNKKVQAIVDIPH